MVAHVKVLSKSTLCESTLQYCFVLESYHLAATVALMHASVETG